MNELDAMFDRQAIWQRARAKLSWTEKLRLAAKLRDAALSMRRSTKEHGSGSVVAESRLKYGR
jgi:hypothetical protein